MLLKKNKISEIPYDDPIKKKNKKKINDYHKERTQN